MSPPDRDVNGPDKDQMSGTDILATNLGSAGYYGFRVETETCGRYELVGQYMPRGNIVSDTIAPFEVESTSVFYGIEGMYHFRRTDEQTSAPREVIFAINYPKISGQQAFSAWAGDEVPVGIDEEGYTQMLADAPTFDAQKDAVLRCGAAAWTVVTVDGVVLLRVWLGDFPIYVSERFPMPVSAFPHRDFSWRPIVYTFQEGRGEFLDRKLEIIQSQVEPPFSDTKMCDLLFFRFLQSQNENVQRAVEQLKRYLEWYETENIGAKRKAVENGLQYAPNYDNLFGEPYWHGSFYEIYDEASNTQYLIDSPTLQPLVEGKINTDEMMESWLHHMEYRMLQMQRRSAQTNRLTFTTIISRMIKHDAAPSIQVINAMRQLASLGPMYVHHVREVIVLDVSDMFSAVAQTCTSWCPESVGRKLNVYPVGTDLEPIIERCAQGEEARAAIRKILSDMAKDANAA